MIVIVFLKYGQVHIKSVVEIDFLCNIRFSNNYGCYIDYIVIYKDIIETTRADIRKLMTSWMLQIIKSCKDG